MDLGMGDYYLKTNRKFFFIICKNRVILRNKALNKYYKYILASYVKIFTRVGWGNIFANKNKSILFNFDAKKIKAVAMIQQIS